MIQKNQQHTGITDIWMKISLILDFLSDQPGGLEIAPGGLTGGQLLHGFVDMVEAAVSDTMSANDKNRFISQHSDLVALRQYVHWIKHIVCADDSVIEDVENMDELMNIMSTSDDIVDTFLKAIKDYIDEATIAMIALPSYKCPACGGDMSPAETKHPYLIPLETTMLFFTLRDRRLLRVKTN